MKPVYVTHDNIEYVRVSKATARRAHAVLEPVYIDSSNMRPFNAWGTTMLMPDYNTLLENDMTFDQYINNFEYYNCDYERGYFTSFYIRNRK